MPKPCDLGRNICFFLLDAPPHKLPNELPSAQRETSGAFAVLTGVTAHPIAIISPRLQLEWRRLTRPTLLLCAPDFHNHHD